MTSVGHRGVVLLAAALRREGLSVSVERTAACASAAATTGDLYWAGRLTLVGRVEDLAVYDRVFYGLPRPPADPDEQPGSEEGEGDGDGETISEAPDDEAERLAMAIELLRHKPFGQLTSDDIALLRSSIGVVHRHIRRRPTRRKQPVPRGTLDLRRTVRQMQRSGGEALYLLHDDRRREPIRLTLVIDVSGSMAAETKALMLACASFVRALPHCEAFVFGTRLTQVSAALRSGSIENAVDRAVALAHDRESGTRIAESLGELMRRHGMSRAVRRATVVIYSDGLERGEPDQLAAQMRRLELLAAKIVWLNPLSASADYRPYARGMAAALPYVDVFRSGHTFADFQDVVAAILEA